MEPHVFDFVKFEKNKAVARFNRFRRIVKLWQILEVLVVFGLITWSSARVPAVLKTTAFYFVEFSTYLCNHHVVFLIGNAIIVALVLLCRQNDAVGTNLSNGGDFYDDYIKHSEAAARQSPSPVPVSDHAPASEDDMFHEEKQIVVCSEETKDVSQCDDVSVAIEQATKQIWKFQRTQSEKLKREIAVRSIPELRRSETENSRKPSSGEEIHGSEEMETLSNEEFRRKVDAFIDKHWCKKNLKQSQFEEYEKKYEFVKENVKSVSLQA